MLSCWCVLSSCCIVHVVLLLHLVVYGSLCWCWLWIPTCAVVLVWSSIGVFATVCCFCCMYLCVCLFPVVFVAWCNCVQLVYDPSWCCSEW